ncbi:MAG: hypothetical protein MR902_03245 [Campylobacter sp.]|nr:hypothetical protein [Campylobacter sp.]
MKLYFHRAKLDHLCVQLSSKKDPSDELNFASSLLKEIVNYTKKLGIMSCLHVCRGN